MSAAKKTRRASGLYFVQQQLPGEPGPIKIGVSRDIGERVRSLQCGSPHPLALLGTVPGDALDERRLHERFQAFRLSGEWFAPDAALLAFIRSLPEDVTVPPPKRLEFRKGRPLDPVRLAVGEALRRVLEQSGISRAAAGRLFGINEKSVRKMISAERPFPLDLIGRLPSTARRAYMREYAILLGITPPSRELARGR